MCMCIIKPSDSFPAHKGIIISLGWFVFSLMCKFYRGIWELPEESYLHWHLVHFQLNYTKSATVEPEQPLVGLSSCLKMLFTQFIRQKSILISAQGERDWDMSYFENYWLNKSRKQVRILILADQISLQSLCADWSAWNIVVPAVPPAV